MGYTDIPLWLSMIFMFGGLGILAWSSDIFVGGASTIAKRLGISPFIIGMVIIGFGTSAPELCVSAMSGLAGHSNLSLGNAYGSCIFNITVILGISVLIFPLVVKPAVSLVAGPLLAATALFSMWVLKDGIFSRREAIMLLATFFVLLPGYCWFDQKTRVPEVEKDEDDDDGDEEGAGVKQRDSLVDACIKLIFGLALLIGSSHILVWGAVDFAKALGVSDLLIGLTIVAAGTSLPELASAVASAKRGEHEFVLGNIVGSNFFNTLAVVGIATCISPLRPGADGTPAFSPYVLTRDLPLMTLLSFTITLFGLNIRHPKWPGVINRLEGLAWILIFLGYTALMIFQETHVNV